MSKQDSSVSLGFSDLPGLQEEDFVTLCIIENFLDFKMGEIWQEIVAELDMEGVKLVPPDGEAADTILRATEERGLGEKVTLDRDNPLGFVFSRSRNTELYLGTISQTGLATGESLLRRREKRQAHSLDLFKCLFLVDTKSCLQGETHGTMESLCRANLEICLVDGKIGNDQTCNTFFSVDQAAKDNQAQAVRQSRPEEKDYSGYHTVHNLEIPNLSVTVSVHCISSSSD